MNCPSCKKQSRCGCGSCKARVKYPLDRAYKITNLPENKSVGIIQCPYCREKFTEEYLTDLEWKSYETTRKTF
jgi:hypothetical protein